MSEMLPEHWKTVRLEEIADVRGGASFPKAYQGNTEGKYPFYKVSDMNLRGNETLMQASNNWVEKDAVKTLRAKLFSKDTVIFPKVGAAVHTNKKRLLSCDGLVDNNVMGVTIRDYDLCIPYYLLYWFVFVDLVDFSNPGPLPSITATRVKNAKIPLPPLPEQRAIAHVLQTIQEAKAARQRELALERERKAALMDYLFSYGTKGEPRKQTEIGEIPESWEVMEFGDLIDIKHGYAFKSEYFTESGDIVLTPGNFLITGGLYWGAKTKFTSQEYPAEFLFEPGDLVVVMTDLTPSTKLLGASAFIPKGKRILHNQRIGKTLLKNSLTSKDFLYWVFNSKAFRKHMALTATGSTVRHTSPSRIKGYKFGLPLNEEQQEIPEILQAFDTKIAALEQETERLEELFHAMLDELMTGKRSAVPLIDAELPN